MRYYYNYNGKTAKVMLSGARTIVMLEFRTMFFDDVETANRYLNTIGFYRG